MIAGSFRKATTGFITTCRPGKPEHRPISDGQMALLVKHVGQFGEHAVAKKAGVKAGDIVVAYDGMSEPVTETQLIARAVQSHKPGDTVELVLLRDGKRQPVTIKLQ